MDYFDIIQEQACAARVAVANRDDLLREIARRAAVIPVLRQHSEEEIFQSLRQREEEGSTGFGGGVAIPHTRLSKAEGFAVFAVTTSRGIDFQAMDRKKVQVFLVILGPREAVREHLRILAALSNIIAHTNVKNQLLNARDNTVIREILLSRLQEQEAPVETQNQKLLLLVLYEDAFFYDIMEFFLQEGIDGATIIESSGMGQYISNIPLFASFIGFMHEQKNHSRTLITVLPENRVDSIIRGIERITGDLDKKQGAMVMTLDVGICKGTMKML